MMNDQGISSFLRSDFSIFEEFLVEVVKFEALNGFTRWIEFRLFDVLSTVYIRKEWSLIAPLRDIVIYSY